jgi:hypothetical protein
MLLDNKQSFGYLMNANVILNNEYATVLYYPESGIVHHTLHKPTTGEPFREVMLAGLEAMKANGAQKWLSDDRPNQTIPPEDAEWGERVWFPQVKAAGWKYWALVVPNELEGRLRMKDFVDLYYERGIRIMVFSTPEDALTWLESV